MALNGKSAPCVTGGKLPRLPFPIFDPNLKSKSSAISANAENLLVCVGMKYNSA